MTISATPVVGIAMGSRSDWPTLQRAAAILEEFGVAHESEIVSAHRTPDKLVAYRSAQTARVLGESLDGDAATRPEH